MDDVWEYVWLLYRESEISRHGKGSAMDIYLDIFQQLPFFCCINMFLDDDVQKTINRYMYCKNTGVPAYSGSYGDQPYVWKEIYFLLNSAFNQRDKMQRAKQEQKMNQQKNNSKVMKLGK